MNVSESGAGGLARTLIEKIEARTATLAVIGLGYVGLPLARAFCQAGFSTIGFDIDAAKVEALSAGQSYIQHIPAEEVAEMVASGRFRASNDFREIMHVDTISICVPTPLNRFREPDLSFVVATGGSIAPFLKRGQLVVLESTSYPGTTLEDLRPILESAGLKSGEDFLLAFSPEREDPGNAMFSNTEIPKVVGGHGEEATRAASALYGAIVSRTVPVSSVATAEAVKLTENIFRAVNIALVNELKVIYGEMGIDIWEVIEAAKTKPFGFMPFYPGPGLGGHCIPIDPFYLTWKAREYEVPTRFIELAGEINTAMPHYVLGRLADALDGRFAKGLNGARILMLGMAYKKNIGDARESPAFRLTELIEARGATVDYYDPYVPEIPMTRAHKELAGRRSLTWDQALGGNYDAALIVTDHDGVNYQALVDALPLVVDTRNATGALTEGREKVVQA